ncbi:MAG: phage holin family protein [Ferrimicrobium sp.]
MARLRSAKGGSVEERSDLRAAISLSLRYLKQETVGPSKRLGGLLAFGLIGSVLISTGVVLLGLGVLRFLQSETGSTFTGHLDWVPYLITAVLLIVVAALVALRVGKRRR